MACDICGSNKGALTELLPAYQTDDIKQICSECERIVNQKNSKLLTYVLNIKTQLLKQFMRVRKESR